MTPRRRTFLLLGTLDLPIRLVALHKLGKRKAPVISEINVVILKKLPSARLAIGPDVLLDGDREPGARVDQFPEAIADPEVFLRACARSRFSGRFFAISWPSRTGSKRSTAGAASCPPASWPRPPGVRHRGGSGRTCRCHGKGSRPARPRTDRFLLPAGRRGRRRAPGRGPRARRARHPS